MRAAERSGAEAGLQSSGKVFFRKRKRKAESPPEAGAGGSKNTRRALAARPPTRTNICLSGALVLLLASCQLAGAQVNSGPPSGDPKAALQEVADRGGSNERLQPAGDPGHEALRRRRWLSPPSGQSASTRVVAVGGQWVELRCPLTSELLDSNHSIVWRKNGVRLNQLEPRQKIHPHNGSLVIAAAQPQLDEAAYECVLVAAPARELKSHRFQLKLILAPRLAAFEFPADAQVGMKLVLTCSALEGQQPISFVWLKDNQIIQSAEAGKQPPSQPSSLHQLHLQQLADRLSVSGASAERKSEYLMLEPEEPVADGRQLLALLSDANMRVRQSDDYSMLSIERLELKHSGRYTCSAQNEAAHASHSSQLLINAPPTLTVEPQDGDLVSGQSALLECAASGQPRPSVGWLRARESSSKLWDYVPIYDNLRYTTLPNGSLAVTNVTQREQGFYLCSAKNGFGPEVTKLIKITVHEPARFGPKYKTLEVRVEERANMICAASGEQPLKLEWLDTANNVIQASDKHFIIDDDPTDLESTNGDAGANLTLSRLILARATRADSGHYTCQASNKYGSDKTVTNLLVQDVPDRPSDLKVTNATFSTISLRWQLTFAGNSPVSSYLIQYQSDDPFDELLMRPPVVSASSGGQLAETSDELTGQQTAAGASSSLKVALDALNLASNLEDADEAIDRTLVELTVEQSSTHLIVKDLSPYCMYRLRLAAINKIGLGEFSDWIRAKTEEAQPSGVPLKIATSATGPNSIKITWYPPDRRSWNGQLTGFNIGYRSVDSGFGLNKTVDWTPPTLQSIMLDADKQPVGARRQAQQSSAIAANLSLLLRAHENNLQSAAKTNAKKQLDPKRNSSQVAEEGEGSHYLLLRQHLRQLLALQQQELVAHLTNLQRSTTYLVWIQAINARGSGPQSHALSVKTLDDVPPSAPALKVQSTSANSITIAWSMLSNFVSSANQYSLFYRRVSQSEAASPINGSSQSQVMPLSAHFETGPFVERTISSQQLMLSGSVIVGGPKEQADSILDVKPTFMHQQARHYQQFVYTLDQLECGSVYELYMTTRNSVGKSEPSSVLTTRTMGEPPLAPSNKNVLFARIGSSDLALNLAAWSTGGCPLTHVTVRYKQAPILAAAATASSSSASASNSSTAASQWPMTTTSVPASLLASVNNLLMAHSSPYLAASGDAGGIDGSRLSVSQGASSSNLQPVYTLKNLAPSTCYELEISAYNSAGQTTALYEFVTLNLNGSRSRKEGAVFRFEQRHDQTFDNSRFVEQQQASFANQSGTGAGQLLPVLLMLFCLVCLVISSSFCYYRLRASWKSHRHSGLSNDSGGNLHCQPGALNNPSPPSSLAGKASVWRVNDQSISKRHHSVLKHRHQDADNDSDSTPTMHYCMRDPLTNQLMSGATLGQAKNQAAAASGSSFSQSVSMKDFNLIAAQPNGLSGPQSNVHNFRTYRNPTRSFAASEASKTATMRARLIGDAMGPYADPAANNGGLQDYGTSIDHNQLCSIYAAAYKQQQHQKQLEQLPGQDTYISNTGNQNSRSAAMIAGGQVDVFPNMESHYEPHQCGFSADGQQQETSWTSAPSNYMNQEQCLKTSGTNYAIPSAKFGDQMNAYDNEQSNQQVPFQQADSYEQAGIDACIQQLMGQQYRSKQQEQDQQQQCSMFINVKLDSNGNRCLYGHENGNLVMGQVSDAPPDQLKLTSMQNMGAQSVVDSSGSSGIDPGAHIDCGSSATGTSNSNASNDGYQLSQPQACESDFTTHSQSMLMQSSMQEIDLKQI